MYKNHKIGVIIPAYNEEHLIAKTLEGIPDDVDFIFVVNDGSTDQTGRIIEDYHGHDSRIQVIHHASNQGLGQSLIDGYTCSLGIEADITAVMDGDNQMHPDDLQVLLDRLIDGNLDYVKGNRLLHRDVKIMPRHRFWGNSVLTILTKFATGYYSLMDPQCAYTAVKNSMLRKIPFETMTKGYAYNADILCMLNIRRARVANVEVRPVYGDERSKICLVNYIPRALLLLGKLFFRRLWRRYVILDFHPLVLFYLFSFVNFFLIIVPFMIRFFILFAVQGLAPRTTLTILIFTILITFQSILFAIWMDMDYNKPISQF